MEHYKNLRWKITPKKLLYRSGGGEIMEQKLIEIAKQYVEMETGPESEVVGDQLFEIAKQVSTPLTKAGQAIVAWVMAEEATDFSMSAGNFFDDMCQAVSAV